MYDPFVRSQPAKLLFVGKAVENRAKISHQVFNIFSFQLFRIKRCGLANQLVSLAQGKRKPRTYQAAVIFQFRNRIRINRVAVNGIAAGAVVQ